MRNQLVDKLSIDPYPGTLNLEIIDPESLERFQALKGSEGIEIVPEDRMFCRARCYPVLIQGQLKGAIILPLVPGYPENKLELIASQNIKQAFSLSNGDVLELEGVSLSSPSGE